MKAREIAARIRDGGVTVPNPADMHTAGQSKTTRIMLVIVSSPFSVSSVFSVIQDFA